MRLLIQRVSEASITIDGTQTAAIGQGLLVLIGVEENDTQEDILYLVPKLIGLRIFSDPEGKMNLNLQQVQGQILLVSQFTLHASTKKGNRPSFIKAAKPEQAISLYEQFIRELGAQHGQAPQTGSFGADMKIALVNDGPVTIFMDSKMRE
jgi:D-tyrosyl-tRNA(Tyr) deacylase